MLPMYVRFLGSRKGGPIPKYFNMLSILRDTNYVFEKKKTEKDYVRTPKLSSLFSIIWSILELCQMIFERLTQSYHNISK